MAIKKFKFVIEFFWEKKAKLEKITERKNTFPLDKQKKREKKDLTRSIPVKMSKKSFIALGFLVLCLTMTNANNTANTKDCIVSVEGEQKQKVWSYVEPQFVSNGINFDHIMVYKNAAGTALKIIGKNPEKGIECTMALSMKNGVNARATGSSMSCVHGDSNSQVEASSSSQTSTFGSPSNGHDDARASEEIKAKIHKHMNEMRSKNHFDQRLW